MNKKIIYIFVAFLLIFSSIFYFFKFSNLQLSSEGTQDLKRKYQFERYSFEYGKPWLMNKNQYIADDDPITFNNSISLQTMKDGETVGFKIFDDVDKNIDDYWMNIDESGYKKFVRQEGLVDGNRAKFIQYYISDGNSSSIEKEMASVFMCGNDRVFFNYSVFLDSEQGNYSVDSAVEILKSFDCYASEGETVIPEINREIFNVN